MPFQRSTLPVIQLNWRSMESFQYLFDPKEVIFKYKESKDIRKQPIT